MAAQVVVQVRAGSSRCRPMCDMKRSAQTAGLAPSVQCLVPRSYQIIGVRPGMLVFMLVQVTGVLRNLAVSLSHAPAFITAAVLPALREAATALSRHQEVSVPLRLPRSCTCRQQSTCSQQAVSGCIVSCHAACPGKLPDACSYTPVLATAQVILNVGRILSKLSLHDGCQAALEADVAYAPLLMRLLSVHASQRPVLLRIAFVLGNLTTASDGYRAQVAAVPGALGAVVSILSDYARPAEEESQGAGEASGAAPGQLRHAAARSGSGRRSAGANHEECAVKMLRLVANLSINVTVRASTQAQ